MQRNLEEKNPMRFVSIHNVATVAMTPVTLTFDLKNVEVIIGNMHIKFEIQQMVYILEAKFKFCDGSIAIASVTLIFNLVTPKFERM